MVVILPAVTFVPCSSSSLLPKGKGLENQQIPASVQFLMWVCVPERGSIMLCADDKIVVLTPVCDKTGIPLLSLSDFYRLICVVIALSAGMKITILWHALQYLMVPYCRKDGSPKYDDKCCSVHLNDT